MSESVTFFLLFRTAPSPPRSGCEEAMPKRSWEACFVLVLLTAAGCAGTTSSGSNGAGTPNGSGTPSGNPPASGTPAAPTPAAPTPVPAPPATGTPPQLALTDFVSGLTSP